MLDEACGKGRGEARADADEGVRDGSAGGPVGRGGGGGARYCHYQPAISVEFTDLQVQRTIQRAAEAAIYVCLEQHCPFYSASWGPAKVSCWAAEEGPEREQVGQREVEAEAAGVQRDHCDREELAERELSGLAEVEVRAKVLREVEEEAAGPLALERESGEQEEQEGH